jgi:hypothetical protein
MVFWHKEMVVDDEWMGGMLIEYRLEKDGLGVHKLFLKEMFYDKTFRWVLVWQRVPRMEV